MKVRHVGITVCDLDKCINFYVNILGFKMHRKVLEAGKFIDGISNLSDVSVTTVKMFSPKDPSSSMIELLKYHSHDTSIKKSSINEGGISHFAITVDNIDEIYKRLIKNNIEFNCKPLLSDDGGAFVTFCRDPENNLIEIVQVLNK